jgi:hypothetical protein
MWHWLIKSDAGTATRISVGVAILLTLALLDIRKHGVAKATRWREYAFLILCVGFAMLYGVINDLITSTISWEYFYYGKELEQTLGPTTPPDWTALHLAAMLVGMKATWTAGLLIGAVLLIANNPRRNRPQAPYRTLIGMLGVIAVITIAFAIVLGILGSRGALNWISSDFSDMFRANLMRPSRFVGVFGIHLGGYVGGLLGLVVSLLLLLRIRVQAHARSKSELQLGGSAPQVLTPGPESPA